MGFISTDVERKLVVTSSRSAGSERSMAVVRVNQNGADAANPWEFR